MRDDSSFNFESVLTGLVLVAVGVFAVTRLLPLLVQAVWKVVPGILVLWLVAMILRAMVEKLLK